jgi:hypothetical protein
MANWPLQPETGPSFWAMLRARTVGSGAEWDNRGFVVGAARYSGSAIGLDRSERAFRGPARRDHSSRPLGGHSNCETALKNNVLGQDLAFTTNKYAGPLDDVSQFADVSGPVVPAQSLHRSSAQGYTRTELGQKRLG